jgi:hypothetical protein
MWWVREVWHIWRVGILPKKVVISFKGSRNTENLLRHFYSVPLFLSRETFFYFTGAYTGSVNKLPSKKL